MRLSPCRSGLGAASSVIVLAAFMWALTKPLRAGASGERVRQPAGHRQRRRRAVWHHRRRHGGGAAHGV